MSLACSVAQGGRSSPRIADSRPGGALLTEAERPRRWHGSRCGTGRWKVHHVALRCLLRREGHGTRRRGDHHGQYASGASRAGGRSRRAGRYPRSRRQPLPLAADIRRGSAPHRCCSGQTRLGPPEAGPRGASGLGHVLSIFSLLRVHRRASRGVVVVADSSAIGSSSALRSIPPDGRSRRPRSTGHALGGGPRPERWGLAGGPRLTGGMPPRPAGNALTWDTHGGQSGRPPADSLERRQ